MRNRSSGTRARLRSSVCIGVLTSAIATGAMASEAEVSFNMAALTEKVTASVLAATLQATSSIRNEGTISAIVVGALFDNTNEMALGSNVSTNNTNTVDNNLIEAWGFGNEARQEIDHDLVENDLQDGAGAASGLLNEGVVTSSVSNSAIAVDIGGFTNGSAANTGNTIRAQSHANTGSTLLSGEIPNSYASPVEGSASVDSSTINARAEGSLVAATGQVNTVGGHQAEVDANAITLDLTSDAPNTVTAGPRLDDNTIAATLRGNNNQSTIRLNSGENPTFEGSAVVTNLQLNTGSDLNFNEALNTNSSIAANVSGDHLLADNTLNGALSVSGNAITSRVAGNAALDNAGNPIGNQIVIDDTLSIQGTQATGGSEIQLDIDGNAVASADATLTILNSQGNIGSGDIQAFIARTQNASITANVDSLVEGTINTTSNQIGTRASGNAATSAILSSGTDAGFDASAAIANNQTNQGAVISADASQYSGGNYAPNNTTIGASSGTDGGVTVDSRISVNENAITAAAFGNETGQTLALNANTLTLDPGVATLSSSNLLGGNVSALGAATVANLQANVDSDVRAFLAGSMISVEADSQGGLGATTLTDNILEVTGNAQDALAAGNSGSNTLSLDGNEVGGASGLASVQIGTNTIVAAELNTATARIMALTDVDGGSIDLSGNTMQAHAYGGTASNSVLVTGTTAQLDSVADDGSSPGINPGTRSVISNYGLLNRQDGSGSTVTATADVSEGGFIVGVEGNLQTATIANDTNRLVGLAFGNQANNTTSIEVHNISTDDTAGNAQVANALNMQNVTGNVSARATGGSVMNTNVQGDVTGSTVSTSDNLIRAQATGNLAITRTTVVANSLSTSQLANAHGVSTDAAFSVENRQDSDGIVSASQLDNNAPATQSADIRTTIEGIDGFGIVGSTVLSNINISETRATANDAANLLTLNANLAETSSAVRNEQTSGGAVTAQMGIAGTPPVAPANYVLGGSGGSPDVIGFVGTDVTVGAGDSLVILFDETAPGGTELAALLNSLGPNVNINGGMATLGEGSYDFSDFDAFSGNYTVGSGSTVSFSGFSTGGSPGVSPAGGVTIAANGPSVVNSTLSVEGNISRGAVTGNSATNALSVQATSITGDLGGVMQEGEATHVVANTQANNADLASNVTAAFAVESAEGGTISGSAISVSNNAQRATAVGNTADSTLSLGGGDGAEAASVAASSELSSVQGSYDYVTATSTMQASAAATMNGSTLAIDGNRNTALAVGNDASNASNVRATNATTTSTTDVNASLTGHLFTSTADHLVSNRQSGESPITATAQSNIFNQDLLATETTGVANSSISMSGNATVAEAATNRATNSLSLHGGADMGATGGVMNSQNSSSAVTASATSDVSMGLTGLDGFATVNGSSLAIEGNTTTALARGNFAGNVLNASAGAGYAPQVADASAVSGAFTHTVTANYAVLNTQENTGPINASSTGTTYRATPAGATSSDVMAAGSSLRISGNLVATEAYGNEASNTLQMAGLNTTMPTAGISNTQRNTAAVSSIVTGAAAGISGTGAVGSSGFGVSGNTISASATGNSVTNRIIGN